jgi:hypothetical protein
LRSQRDAGTKGTKEEAGRQLAGSGVQQQEIPLRLLRFEDGLFRLTDFDSGFFVPSCTAFLLSGP